MKVQQEFSKSAKHYDSYNKVQEQVAKKLVSWIKDEPQNILDIGCGSGAVYKKIDWKFNRFTGVDFSSLMLKNHPKADNVTLLYKDFNEDSTFKHLTNTNIDCVTASSSLQWAKNMENIFRNLARFYAHMYLAIFTSNTFRTLNKSANIKSILPTQEEILYNANRFTVLQQEVKKYNLYFESKREMFNYIKKSGVSGNRNILTFKQTKELVLNYPLSYLEFEVIFLHIY